MKSATRSLAILRMVAFAAAACGILSTLWALRTIPTRLRLIERKEGDIHVLAGLEADTHRYDPHLATLTSISKGAMAPPDAIFRRVAPGAPPPTVAGGKSEPLDGPWQLHRVEIALADCPLDSVAAFLHACETSRPPWRASHLRIQALDPGSTRGRAAITLEGVGRTEEGGAP